MYDQVYIPEPGFGSNITKNILKLEKLKNETNILYDGVIGVGGSIFLGLKSIFQIVESVSSARIEGNRTTVLQFIQGREKIPNDVTGKQKQKEIKNIHKGIRFIEEEYKKNHEIEQDFKIDNTLIYNLHSILMEDLLVGEGYEGDNNPGNYRDSNVTISNSSHIPPDYLQVAPYMDELLSFINEYKSQDRQFDLLRIAIAHHRFVWIHPFGNGNGRMVRLLTYAMLIKYGYIGNFGLLNPSTLFCLEREKYYNYLNNADSGDKGSLLKWCDYCIEGMANEMDKLELLCDQSFVIDKILKNSLKYLVNIGLIDETEEKILKILYNKKQIVAKDVLQASDLHPTTISLKLRHLKKLKLIGPKHNKKTIYEAILDENTEMFNAIFHELGNNGFNTWLDLDKIN